MCVYVCVFACVRMCVQFVIVPGISVSFSNVALACVPNKVQ